MISAELDYWKGGGVFIYNDRRIRGSMISKGRNTMKGGRRSRRGATERKGENR